jgi:hypothetical protein
VAKLTIWEDSDAARNLFGWRIYHQFPVSASLARKNFSSFAEDHITARRGFPIVG